MTKEGYDVISKVAPENEEMIAESMEVLEQEEREELLYLLKKLRGKSDEKKSEDNGKRL